MPAMSAGVSREELADDELESGNVAGAADVWGLLRETDEYIVPDSLLLGLELGEVKCTVVFREVEDAALAVDASVCGDVCAGAVSTVCVA